jgi:flagellar motor switch protein FliG
VSTDHLSGLQKAAIIVRVLLAEGIELPLGHISADRQTELTRAFASLKLIDRPTMLAVIDEFADMLEQVGMSFPETLDDAIALLDGKLDAQAARQLRAMARGANGDDPWTEVELAPDAELTGLLQAESLVVGAVILSKLSTDKAAGLLAALPGKLARDLALAVARTETIAPDAVTRIGAAIVAQLRDKPPRAFDDPSTRRVGEILNATPSDLRDEVLTGLDQSDADFATGVRRSIFTFQDIPARVAPRDVAQVARAVGEDDIRLILAADDPASRDAIEFLLDNMSKRLAEGLREDASALPPPSRKALDRAQSRISAAVRKLADERAITLLTADGDGDAD